MQKVLDSVLVPLREREEKYSVAWLCSSICPELVQTITNKRHGFNPGISFLLNYETYPVIDSNIF